MKRVELDVGGEEWDRELAHLGGHPWQSALWGNARRNVDCVIDHRWLVCRGSRIIQMVRFEERRIPALGKIAWIPRGPVTKDRPSIGLDTEIRECLKDHGFMIAVANPWLCHTADSGQDSHASDRPRTIWIDLTVGRDRLWRNLSQHWRRGVGVARRKGVVVETTNNDVLISEYFELCKRVSQLKEFELRTSAERIQFLLDHPNRETEAQLFIARCEGHIAAGALAFRCGQSVHYFGGGSDRTFTKQHPGEAVHWAIIEWALDRGCRCYDLEGIIFVYRINLVFVKLISE